MSILNGTCALLHKFVPSQIKSSKRKTLGVKAAKGYYDPINGLPIVEKCRSSLLQANRSSYLPMVCPTKTLRYVHHVDIMVAAGGIYLHV
jgi:hypothetical protein